jgi:hypothetical protein
LQVGVVEGCRNQLFSEHRAIDYEPSGTQIRFVLFLRGGALISAAIGYAAWKGKPKRFDREMYWTAFVSVGALAALVIVYSLRMQADIRAWRHLSGLVGLGLGALIFGVATGCGVGILTHRRDSVSEELPQ